MDPATFIVALSAQLLCSGGLLFMIARRLPPGGGVAHWAGGMMLFGAAYMLRLALGLGSQSAWGLGSDAAMVAAVLLFIAGLRNFAGRAPLRARTGALVLAGFVAVQFVTIVGIGHTGRHIVLNLALGLLYMGLVSSVGTAIHRVEAVLRRPMLLLTGLMALLAVMTLVRAAVIATLGSGYIVGGRFAQLYYGYASLAAVLLAMGLLWLVFERLAGQLADLATRDALTRLLNRAGLDDVLQRHFGARDAAPLTLLAIDIDHFKRINDSHGHAAGDAVLRAVAGALARHVRPNDLVARVGGEEFIVCCPACDADCALRLAERLREATAALATPATPAAAPGGTLLRCTVSVGISRPCASLADWSRAAAEADAALYAAKSAGRNRVRAA